MVNNLSGRIARLEAANPAQAVDTGALDRIMARLDALAAHGGMSHQPMTLPEARGMMAEIGYLHRIG
ncbi:hypothetical protein [Acidocella sp.]|uniref:hypothetical protein n=1 Tax=Acidocella sp. TaxID=50710 RepID=UPI00183F3D6A|nr:hypothetical protein [Acidocella sp.]NNM55850.1 hypothetical protein [Acidocella sp.]